MRGALLRVLADDEVSGCRHDAERRAQAARVLEPVLERDRAGHGRPRGRAPGSGRARGTARVLAAERARGALDVLVLGLGLEEAGDRLRRERARIVRAPVAEDAARGGSAGGRRRPAPAPRGGPGAPARRRRARRRRGASARRCRPRRSERSADDRLRPLGGEAQRDDAAHRVADDRRRQHLLVLGDGRDVGRQVGEALDGRGAARFRRGPEDRGRARGGARPAAAPAAVKLNAAPPSPWTSTSGGPVPADPVARAQAADLRNVRLKPPKERCRGHPAYRIL